MQLYNFFPNADLCVTHTIQHRPNVVSTCPCVPNIYTDRNMAVNSIFFMLSDFKIDFEMNIFSELLFMNHILNPCMNYGIIITFR